MDNSNCSGKRLLIVPRDQGILDRVENVLPDIIIFHRRVSGHPSFFNSTTTSSTLTHTRGTRGAELQPTRLHQDERLQVIVWELPARAPL